MAINKCGLAVGVMDKTKDGKFWFKIWTL